MGAMCRRIDRHLYLSAAPLFSFVVAGDPNAGVTVGLDFNTEVNGATADLAIFYVILLRDRGIDQYADTLPAVGTFDVLFSELSYRHLLTISTRPRTTKATNNT